MYYFYNKKNALIYKCDSIEVAVKYAKKNKDIVGRIELKNINLKLELDYMLKLLENEVEL